MKKTLIIGGICLFLLCGCSMPSKDKEAPLIHLKGESKINIMLGETFVDPGYEATDSKDGDLTSQVQVIGQIDTTKAGEYDISYEVQDQAGNKVVQKRKVVVLSEKPLLMSVKEFSLDGFFENTILPKTEDAGDAYTDQIIFAGDSMALYYNINELVPASRLWYRNSLSPETALDNTIYHNYIDTGKTFRELFASEKPNIVIMTLGTNSVAFMEPDYFIEKYTELLKQLREGSPDTVLIVQSIPPVDKSWDDSGRSASTINNDKINKLNYRIAKMCHTLKVPFLNSAGAMKDEDGACKKGYCIEKDGIHPTREGQEQLMKYAQTHVYHKKTA